MKLNFTQKQMLALYFELYDECYNISDNSCVQKAQNCCYFFQHFRAFDNSYYFTLNWGIFSASLQVQINDLAKKEEEILNFYQDYLEKNNNKYYLNYQEQLKTVLNELVIEEVIPNIALYIYMVKDIAKIESGMDILCLMLYTIEVRYPELNNFKEINAILEGYGYNNLELNEKIWKTLKFLGLSKIEAQEKKLTIS